MHLVGFIIGIYHDTRFSECQNISMSNFFISAQRHCARVFQLVFVPLLQCPAIHSGLNNNQTPEGHPLWVELIFSVVWRSLYRRIRFIIYNLFNSSFINKKWHVSQGVSYYLINMLSKIQLFQLGRIINLTGVLISCANVIGYKFYCSLQHLAPHTILVILVCHFRSHM